MRSGRWSIFRRARLLSLLKSSLPFKHWSMDMLVKLAYAMKKKVFDTGSVIIQQGDRIEHLWIIADGKVRISHNVIPPSSIDTLRSGGSNVRGRNRQPKQPITVDVADLFERDCIGLIESMEESTTTKKSERDAIGATRNDIVSLLHTELWNPGFCLVGSSCCIFICVKSLLLVLVLLIDRGIVSKKI